MIVPVPFLFHVLSLAAQESFHLTLELWLYSTERCQAPSFVHSDVIVALQGTGSMQRQKFSPILAFVSSYLKKQREVGSKKGPAMSWTDKQVVRVSPSTLNPERAMVPTAERQEKRRGKQRVLNCILCLENRSKKRGRCTQY